MIGITTFFGLATPGQSARVDTLLLNDDAIALILAIAAIEVLSGLALILQWLAHSLGGPGFAVSRMLTRLARLLGLLAAFCVVVSGYLTLVYLGAVEPGSVPDILHIISGAVATGFRGSG